MIKRMLAIWSLVPLPFLKPAWTSGSSRFMYCWSLVIPFRYDLNQIPYNYTVEVRNRFKGLDPIDREPDELWTEVRDTVRETGIKTIPMEKKCKKSKWLSEEALQIAVKRREAKSREKERYSHLNAEFQSIARRDKKSLLQRSMQRNRGKQQNGKDYRSLKEN